MRKLNVRSVPPWISLILRYLLGAAIIYWLLQNQTLDWSHISTLTLPFVLFGIILVSLQFVLSAFRVRLLLHGHGIEVALSQCVKFNAVGIFYSTFMPGGVSGDVARAYFFWREYPEVSKASLAGALFLDRLYGLTTLIFVGLLAATFLLSIDDSMLNYVVIGWVLLIGGVCCYIWLGRNLFIDEREIPKARLAILAFNLRKFFSKIKLENYKTSTIWLVLLLSACVHIAAIVTIYLFSMHVLSGLSIVQVAAVSPVGLLANALPLSPGGIGVGEKSFDMLFGLLGGVSGGNAFLIARVFLYSPALLGGGILLATFLKAHKFKMEKS
jgi:glycosyltransferase 2 family protein